MRSGASPDLGALGTVTRTWVATGEVFPGEPIVISRPDNAQAGDWLLFQYATTAAESVANPPDWRPLGASGELSGTISMYHVVGASDPPTYQLGSNTSGIGASWAFVAYRNVSSIDSSQVLTLSPTQPSASVTVSHPNALAVIAFYNPQGDCVLGPGVTRVIGSPWMIGEKLVPDPALTGLWQLTGCNISVGALAVILAP